MKSFNQLFIKEKARLQSIQDKQHYDNKTTNRRKELSLGRNNKVNDQIDKTERIIVNDCIANNIGTIVDGNNETLHKGSNNDRQNNLKFCQYTLRNSAINS